MLGNNKIVHNITIDSGPLTESDHLPIIVTLTSKAITNPILPRPNINRTDWEKFSSIVENQLGNITLSDNMTKNEIDQALNEWYDAINSGINQSMPKNIST